MIHLLSSSYLSSHLRPLSCKSLYRLLAFHVSPFYIQLLYFIIMSLFGFLALKVSKPRIPVPPDDLDLFFTSVSASTVSSMTTVEMEAFSNSQLILITFLMFLGGDVFYSVLELLYSSFNLSKKQSLQDAETPLPLKQHPPIPSATPIEISLSSPQKKNESCTVDCSDPNVANTGRLRRNSIRCLGFVVLGYLMVLHMVGSCLVSSYISIIPSAAQVLRNKGINIHTCSVFTIVSTFASCGFVPTNENMIVFNQNPGLLLLILPFVFLGNTLYPPFLRLVVWALHKVTRREEMSYILNKYEEMGYDHILSGVHCLWLVATVLGLNLMQLVLFCCMEWRSENMQGLNSYQKLISSLFQISNVRHAGESVFDLSTLSSATLVLFILMMYLPPYTRFVASRSRREGEREKRRGKESGVVLSEVCYLVLLVIVICITEKERLREDPLNFNVLSVSLEVMSAYGNVGL